MLREIAEDLSSSAGKFLFAEVAMPNTPLLQLAMDSLEYRITQKLNEIKATETKSKGYCKFTTNFFKKNVVSNQINKQMEWMATH
jgi:hypothetical protein